MIEGLAQLPWVNLALRKGPREPYDCSKDPCKLSDESPQAAGLRKVRGCGFVPPAERTAPLASIGGVGFCPVQPTVCPGYTTRLPAVQEASAASWWKADGELRSRYPDQELTALLVDAIEVLGRARAEVDLHELRELQAKGQPPPNPGAPR